MGCSSSKNPKASQDRNSETFDHLAAHTPFNVNEVESLYELFRKLSSSIVKDGFIQKEELLFALFRNHTKRNLFADRRFLDLSSRLLQIFHLFDVNRNGHIEFEEFIKTLSIFHPQTPEAVKIKYAFKLYDLRHTGYIEREELKEMVLALLNESDLRLSDEIIESIVDKTFNEADTKSDGKIDQEEWEAYVTKNPSLLKNMTLPYLMDITLSFPSFVLNTEAEQSQS